MLPMPYVIPRGPRMPDYSRVERAARKLIESLEEPPEPGTPLGDLRDALDGEIPTMLPAAETVEARGWEEGTWLMSRRWVRPRELYGIVAGETHRRILLCGNAKTIAKLPHDVHVVTGPPDTPPV